MWFARGDPLARCVCVCVCVLGGGSGWKAHLLMIVPLRVHAVDDAGVLRLERAHVVLRRLDRVLLRQLVPVVRPLLLQLGALLAQRVLIGTERRGRLRALLLVVLHHRLRQLHRLLRRLLVPHPPRPVQLHLLLLEAAALLALSPCVIRLRVVAVLVGPALEIGTGDVGAVRRRARRRQRARARLLLGAAHRPTAGRRTLLSHLATHSGGRPKAAPDTQWRPLLRSYVFLAFWGASYLSLARNVCMSCMQMRKNERERGQTQSRAWVAVCGATLTAPLSLSRHQEAPLPPPCW